MKKSKAEEQRAYDDYNKKYMAGYKQMMKNIEMEKEDRRLKAYDAGDTRQDDWASHMNMIPILRRMNQFSHLTKTHLFL